MKRLILLRHAKSDYPSGVRDHERPLAPRGVKAARAIGATFVRLGYHPDLVLVSSAERTRETWARARAAAPGLPEGRRDPRLYEASLHGLVNIVRETPAEVRTLLLVGHNPGLEMLAAELVGAGDAALRQRMGSKYPTGGLAAIDFAVEDWRDVGRGLGTLVGFHTPRDGADETG